MSMSAGLFSSLRFRILLVALAPCLAFAMVVGLAITERMGARTRMVHVQELVGMAGQISALVHEAQRERGASSLFLGRQGDTSSGPSSMRSALRTDAARTALDAGRTGLDPAAFGAGVARRNAALTEQFGGDRAPSHGASTGSVGRRPRTWRCIRA